MDYNITQYLEDHGNAGNCAYNYYNGTHDPDKCPAPPGYCAMTAYLIAVVKNAEQKARLAQQNPVFQPVVPFINTSPGIPPIPPVTSTEVGAIRVADTPGGSGGGGVVGWHDAPVEQR